MHGLTRVALAAFGLALLWGASPAPAPALAGAPEWTSGWTPGGASGRLSGTAAELADWVSGSGDNGGRPFVIVDKLAADVFVFDAQGRLQGAAPVLVGMARGDDSAPGVGDLPLSAIRPDERTTPAGRFVARFGAGHGHRVVLWVDYADEIALHPVVTANPRERRLQRLHSPAPADHRITYGCINVPAAFYRDVVVRTFSGGDGVVYVLPDTRPLEEVFPEFAARASAPVTAVGDAGAQRRPRLRPVGSPPSGSPPGGAFNAGGTR